MISEYVLAMLQACPIYRSNIFIKLCTIAVLISKLNCVIDIKLLVAVRLSHNLQILWAININNLNDISCEIASTFIQICRTLCGYTYNTFKLPLTWDNLCLVLKRNSASHFQKRKLFWTDKRSLQHVFGSKNVWTQQKKLLGPWAYSTFSLVKQPREVFNFYGSKCVTQRTKFQYFSFVLFFCFDLILFVCLLFCYLFCVFFFLSFMQLPQPQLIKIRGKNIVSDFAVVQSYVILLCQSLISFLLRFSQIPIVFICPHRIFAMSFVHSLSSSS